VATHPLEGQAKRISAYVGEDEIYEDRPLYQALVEQARIQGCAGATALRGMVGFGASSRDVAKHALRMSTDCPVLVSVIDEAPRIAALAEVWSTMIPSGLVTIDDVRVVSYCARGECLQD
jgi:PII-like signaling protein